jgi:hypothetical protein
MSFWPKEFAANLKGKKKSKKSFQISDLRIREYIAHYLFLHLSR